MCDLESASMAQYPSSAGPQPIDKTRETCVLRSGSSVPTPSSSLPASQAPALESHTVVQSVHVMEALYAFLSPGQEASPLLLLPQGMRGLSNPERPLSLSLSLSLYFRRGYGAEGSPPTHTHTLSLSLSLSFSFSLKEKLKDSTHTIIGRRNARPRLRTWQSRR